MAFDDNKQRIVQELVPGKQITLAHVIANPDVSLLDKINLSTTATGGTLKKSAIGVLTVTPAQTSVILADIAIKASGVALGDIDFHEYGSLLLTGTVSEVEASLQAILSYAVQTLHYEVCEVTRT